MSSADMAHLLGLADPGYPGYRHRPKPVFKDRPGPFFIAR
jgi:hypothetical protein